MTPSTQTLSLNSPRYYRSFVSYEIPFRLSDPLTYLDTEGLCSYYAAYHDSEGRVVRFDKLQLVRAEKESRKVTLPTPVLPGTALYFRVLRSPFRNEPGIGERLNYLETEKEDEFFAATAKSDEVTLLRRETAFSDHYEYWQDGKLRKRIMCKSFQPPVVACYDQQGRPVAEELDRSPGSTIEMHQAANWRKVALSVILADGKVDEAEVKILQKELKGADGKIDEEGLKFLIELRVAAQKKAKATSEPLTDSFEKFFFKVVTENVLKDGKVDATEATWLRENLFADKMIDDKEWEFLTTINKKAKTKSPEFETLYKYCETSRAKVAKKKSLTSSD